MGGQPQTTTNEDANGYVWDFRTKYKTEICRNWELFGYCEFSESVRINDFDYLNLVFICSWRA